MPNHITNILRIEGKAERVAEILTAIKSETRALDFNNIYPMPSDLEGTTSPVKIISEEDYIEQENRIKMGNLSELEKKFGVSKGMTEKIQKTLLDKYGVDNWYDWACNNWGTKWNAYSVELSGDNEITFETAWATPYNVMKRLSDIYKDVLIKVRYADEDFGYNVGEYVLRGGVEVDSDIPDGGSIEALELAIDVTKSDYHLTDYLCDLGGENLDNPYYKKLIELAHKKGCLMEYPTEVLNILKSLAMEDEQYERIVLIDKMLDKLAV
jgi:hypothetical protein